MPAYQYLTYELLDEGTIARIMLNRPAARNAQNRGLLVELGDAMLAAEADDQVRVVILGGTGSTGSLLVSTAIASVGSAIGQIITAPFSAGVTVLLYTDRRMRAEAFDLVLQSGAAGGPYGVASTDNLWLTRPV